MFSMLVMWCMVECFVGLFGFGCVRLLMNGWCRLVG